MRNDKHRKLVCQALETLGGKATRDQIVDLIGTDFPNPQQSIGLLLHYLCRDHLLREEHGLFCLMSYEPPPNANGDQSAVLNVAVSDKVTLAPFQQGRGMTSVSIYQSPIVIEDAIAVWIRFEGGQRFKMPIQGARNICVGPDTPQWTPEQETNRNIEAILVLRKNGELVEYPTHPRHSITFAGERSDAPPAAMAHRASHTQVPTAPRQDKE